MLTLLTNKIWNLIMLKGRGISKKQSMQHYVVTFYSSPANTTL
jgi:hypothetical protein